jgi:hypothetical protein
MRRRSGCCGWTRTRTAESLLSPERGQWHRVERLRARTRSRPAAHPGSILRSRCREARSHSDVYIRRPSSQSGDTRPRKSGRPLAQWRRSARSRGRWLGTHPDSALTKGKTRARADFLKRSKIWPSFERGMNRSTEGCGISRGAAGKFHDENPAVVPADSSRQNSFSGDVCLAR